MWTFVFAAILSNGLQLIISPHPPESLDLLQALVNFRASSSLEGDPRFDEMWTLVRSEALLSQRLVDLDHQVQGRLRMNGIM